MQRKQVAIQVLGPRNTLFGVDLDLAVHHLRQGDDVHLIVCRGDLPACPTNSRHDKLACALCISKLDRALSAPDLQGIKVHEIDLKDVLSNTALPDFESMDDVKAFTQDGVNHGQEAASSVITVLRDPRPDLTNEQALVKANVLTTVALLDWFTRFFAENPMDRIYLWNGRYSSQMPVIRAAEASNTHYVVYELFHDAQKYILVEGTFFHDLDEKKRDIERLWQDETPMEEKEAIGHRFFHERRYGKDDRFTETKYRQNQERGNIPADFDETRRNVIIYNSSEDEFAAVTGYDNPVYNHQMEGLQAILDDPRLADDLIIWLRVHPHLANRNNSQTKIIDALQHPQLRVIGSSEKVDSYALAESAEKVITFGSSLSVESAYIGTPSILIGREPYEDLGCCYTPKTHDEVIQLVNDRELAPLPQTGALKFGYWVIAREKDYLHYDPLTKSLNGFPIRPNRFLQLFTQFWWSRYGHALRSIPRRLRRLVSSSN